MIFGCADCKNLSIKINNKTIDIQDHINLLGITFDKQLTFKYHLLKTRNKISRCLGLLHRVKNLIPLSHRKQLYYALIDSHITYGITIWGSTSKNLTKPLEILQKKAIRFIDNLNFRDHTQNSFARHKILNFQNLYNYFISIEMFKAYNNLLPIDIQNLYSRVLHQRNTRSAHLNLNIQRRSTKIQNLRLSVQGPYFWNFLPVTIRSSINLIQFKKRLKIFFHSTG